MKRWMFVTASLTLATCLGGHAEAKGCLKGAVVGGLAGHMVHHGILGAAGGCAVGHHEASKHDRQQREMRQQDMRTRDQTRG